MDIDPDLLWVLQYFDLVVEDIEACCDCCGSSASVKLICEKCDYDTSVGYMGLDHAVETAIRHHKSAHYPT